jgi:predicted transcriptional regulator
MIVQELTAAAQPMNPVELATAVNSAGITVERHLRSMVHTGLVLRTFIGQRSYYSLATLEPKRVSE